MRIPCGGGVLVISALVVGCGAGASSGPVDGAVAQDASRAGTVVGPAGGIVASDDGRVTLTIPAGALATDQPISIRLVPNGGQTLSGGRVIASYRFEPDGLVFASPATVAITIPALASASGGNTSIPLVVATTSGRGVLEMSPRQELAIDLESNAGTFTTELAHFTDLVVYDFGDHNATNQYFTFLVEPTPPATAHVGEDYGIGLRVSVRNFFSQEVELTYDDASTGLTYSGGSAPVVLGSALGLGDAPAERILPAGRYTCPSIGPATYAATVQSATFSWVPTLDPDDDDCSAEHPCAVPAWPPAGASISYRLSVSRQVSCAAAIPPETSAGPPYSGLVQYRGWLLEYGASPGFWNGSFYAGGTEQAAFDAYVARIERIYGIMPDRGALGSCRQFSTFIAEEGQNVPVDPTRPPVGHVGVGEDDAIRADFLSTTSEPSFLAPWVPASSEYQGRLFEMTPPMLTTAGIGIHVPASAPTAAITLEGWDEASEGEFAITPNEFPTPGSGVTISWQADQIDAEYLHVWLQARGDFAEVYYECFVEPSMQILSVPPDVVTALFANASGSASEHLFFTVNIFATKRTTVAYQGRTLVGFTVRPAYLGSDIGGE